MKKIMDLNPDEYKAHLAIPIKITQIIISVYIKFIKDAGFARAGGLAFSTLLAVVPFAALVVSLMSAFGALDSVQEQIMDFIVQLLVPTRQAEIKSILEQFLDNSNTLGVVGIVFFTITSIMLLNTVTVNLNAICGCGANSSFMNKFKTYASVIIFGSLLLAASTTLTSSFKFPYIENIAVLSRFFLRLAPFVFDFFVILLLIGAVPSGKIKLRYLLSVSVIGAVFWELLKHGFFYVSSWAIRMSVIYGTIAVIPIFLFWVYIIWIIIICTLEAALVLQHNKTAWKGNPITAMLPGEQMAFSFSVFMTIAKAFENGNKAPSSEDLSNNFSLPIDDVEAVTQLLSKEGFLIQAGDDGKAWLPARSLSQIRTAEVIDAIYGGTGSESIPEIISSFYKGGLYAVADSSIADLLETDTKE